MQKIKLNINVWQGYVLCPSILCSMENDYVLCYVKSTHTNSFHLRQASLLNFCLDYWNVMFSYLYLSSQCQQCVSCTYSEIYFPMLVVFGK